MLLLTVTDKWQTRFLVSHEQNRKCLRGSTTRQTDTVGRSVTVTVTLLSVSIHFKSVRNVSMDESFCQYWLPAVLLSKKLSEKNCILWEITPSIRVKVKRRFEGTCPPSSGSKSSQGRNQHESGVTTFWVFKTRKDSLGRQVSSEYFRVHCLFSFLQVIHIPYSSYCRLLYMTQ
jgi:hypothetical protein